LSKLYLATEETISINVADDRSVTAIRTPVEGSPTNWMFIYAPGAGSNIHDPFGTQACRILATKGISCVRFQFPYMEIGQRRPNSRQTVEATWRRVIEVVRPNDHKLVIGGRSMGGRIASQVVAQGMVVNALALFAYPLHPPGKPSQWRDEHLPVINVPTLFCSGTRDTFATPAEVGTVAVRIPDATVHILDGADHGFSVLKSSNRTRKDVWDEATDALLQLIDHLE